MNIIESDLSLRQPPPLPLKKKALLIGIQCMRQDSFEITQENVERKDVNAVPKRKKKKRQKDREEFRLKGPHHDVIEMKQLLIDVYDYDPKDITVLIDDDNPDHIQPTKENMIQKMIELVDGALAGDRFFFHFSDCARHDDPWMEDRNYSVLVSSDGEEIEDNHLRKLLVDPLPIGSTLVALFDSAHSSSILDLEHIRCNRVYVPWINKGRRKTDSVWNNVFRRNAGIFTSQHNWVYVPWLNKGRCKTDVARNIIMRPNARIDVPHRSVTRAKRLSRSATTSKRTAIDQVLSSPLTSLPTSSILVRAQMSPLRTKSKKSLPISTDMEKETWYGNDMFPIKRCSSLESLYCTGNCRYNPSKEGELSADVISLSWEDPQVSSMTKALIKILKNDSNPSLKDLLTLISHDLHVFYVSMHRDAKQYKKNMNTVNDSRRRMGKLVFRRKSVEMNNFQTPQISSLRPLDMSRRWHL